MSEYDEYYEEDEAPAPKKRRVVRPAAEEAPAFTEEDPTEVDDVAPPARKAAPTAAASGIRGGWSAGQQVMESSSPFAQNLKLDSNTQIIKFLDDAPYASYSRHWVERKGGVRPYVCLQSVGKECPLCDIGDRPQATSAFNVVVVGDDGGVVLKTWDVGTRIFSTLKNFATSSRSGGLSHGYYAVSKVGQKQQSQTLITPVRESLLFEDYGIEPPSAEAIAAAGKYDADIINVPMHKDLTEIAAELSSGDEY
jgi:hypothetical protein